MTKVELCVPDKLAADLDCAGLLDSAKLEQLLRQELRALALRQLDEILQKAENEPEPPMTTEEIQAEINAYRAEKRRAAGS